MLRFTSSFSHHLIQLITMWWSTDSSAPRQYMLQIWWWDHKADHWSLILVPTTLMNHFVLEHLFVVANPLRVQRSAQIQISQAVSSKHPPPGFFIIAHMGVEVLQQIEYRVSLPQHLWQLQQAFPHSVLNAQLEVSECPHTLVNSVRVLLLPRSLVIDPTLCLEMSPTICSWYSSTSCTSSGPFLLWRGDVPCPSICYQLSTRTH